MPETQMPERSDEEQESFDEAILKKYCTHLIEHFSSVRIIATRHRSETNDTVACSSGAGDYYSQIGAVRDWLIRQDERTKENVRNED